MFIVDTFHNIRKRFNIKIQTALKQIQSYSGLMVNVKVINNQTLASIYWKWKMLQSMNSTLLILGQFVLKVLCSTAMVLAHPNWCLVEYKFTKFHEQSITITGNQGKIIRTWIAFFSFTFYKKSINWIWIKQQIETYN